MKKALLRAALLTTTLAVTLMPVTPANAATLEVLDAPGDVWKSTYDMTTDEETVEPAGTVDNVDLVHTTLKHTAKRVVVKATYTELRKRAVRYALLVELRTNEGLRRDLGVETITRDSWAGTAFFGSPKRELRCQGMTHAIDYGANTVNVSVPRACLSAPRWVQFRASELAFDGDETTMITYFDHAESASPEKPRTWSSKVKRG